MRRFMGPALALALIACAPGEEMAPEQPAMQQQEDAVSAPTPEGVAIRVGADQAGQTIAVPAGQRFAVELVGVPTAGYVWAAVSVPDFLAASGEASGPTTEAQRQPGFTGGNHWEVFVFEARAAG
ncbi:MAG: hypothetical protein AB7T08_14360, partial [Hyphomonadaceae bacterium]